jgi:phosphoribosylpyrophosphate synthetase
MNKLGKTLEEAGIAIFRGSGNTVLAERMLRKLAENLGQDPKFEHIDFGWFNDGELFNKLPGYETLGGKTVFFFQTINSLELMEEFFDLCWAMKYQYGVAHIIAVVPFLRYRRQDPRKKPWEINRLRMIIHRMSQNGIEKLITVTPHSGMMQEYCAEFGIDFLGLDVTMEMIRAISAFVPTSEEPEYKTVKVYTPDVGSIPRAVAVAKKMGVGILFNIKLRKENNIIQIVEANQEEIQEVIGRYPNLDIQYATEDLIRGSIIIMIDDEMSTGHTANTTGQMLMEMGAAYILFVFTHSVCTHGWKDKLFLNDPFEKVFSFDTIHRGPADRTGGLVRDVSVGDLLASTLYREIKRIMRAIS